jgi:SAM-dependent methyltransferase
MIQRARGNLLYNELAAWWPLLSPPEDYKEEAAFLKEAILRFSPRRPRTVLELGSGGGNNASHLKKAFQMTLVDLSPRMLSISGKLNPDCEHVRGDMRTVRLGKQFDAVFVHDAIIYMTSARMLRQALETAAVHCRPGGVALFVPDWTRETFQPSTSCEGGDDGARGLRYLEWTIDHDPEDSRYTFYMSYLLRKGTRVRQYGPDVHQCGLFARREWLDAMREAGFRPKSVPFEHSSFERGAHIMFVGVRKAGEAR